MNVDNDKIIPFIDFTITDKCNYNCEYCLQESRLEREKNNLGIHASDETINNFMEIIKNLKGQWEIRLIGGEAFLHPRFFEFIEYIVCSGHNVQITTNFSLPIETYKKFIDICGENLVGFCASLHLTQVNSIEEFLNKAIDFDNFKSKKTSFVVSSVLTEENFETVKEMKNLFNKHNITFDFIRLILNGDFVIYNEEIENYLSQSSENDTKKIKTLKGNNMFGIICNTGYKSLNVQVNGEVRRCYTKQTYLNDLGSIEKNTFKFLKKSMPCLSKDCLCYNFYLKHNLIEHNKKNYPKASYLYFLGETKRTFKLIKRQLHLFKLFILGKQKV